MTIVAVCSIIEKGKKILILQRSKDDIYYPSMWDFPGGQLNENEDIIDGVKREVKEETNLEINILFPVDVSSRTFTKMYLVLITFVSSFKSGEVKLSSEHQDFKWVTATKNNKLDGMTPLTKRAFYSYLKLRNIVNPL